MHARASISLCAMGEVRVVLAVDRATPAGARVVDDVEGVDLVRAALVVEQARTYVVRSYFESPKKLVTLAKRSG